MNTLRILEISWLVFGIAGLGLCGYNLITESVQAAMWPLIFTVIAAIFYTVRRKQRILYEKNRSHHTETPD
jgi:hypothetical protein